MSLADFLLYFLRHNGVALMIAAPAIIYLFLNPPRNWRDDP